MDKWNSLRFLIASVEAGNFASAATKLGADPSTVSKAVRRLEEQLNTTLLQRSTRAISLTEAGEIYLKSAKEAIAQLEESENYLHSLNEQPKGVLRINSPVTYGKRYLSPVISRYMKAHPEVNIELNSTDSYVDIIENRFDIGIRIGHIDDSRLIARQLSPMDYLICASPELSETLPQDFSHKNFADYPWIRFRFKRSGKIMPIIIPGESGIQEINPGNNVVVNDGVTLAKLAGEGFGLIQAPHFTVKRAIEKGELKAVLPAIRHPSFGVYIVYPKREYLPKKTSKFIQYLLEEVEALGEFPQHTWAEKLKTLRQW
jgi:DNA-binding transcriptional LysR family regulator